MRGVVGFFGVACGLIVIGLVARYGYKTADNDVDGLISGFLFGTIAAGGLGGHAVAARLWRHNRLWATAIGLVAALALIVNLTNSVGAIAGRGDQHTAERIKIAQAAKDDRAELARLLRERESMPAFTATSSDAVTVAREAVTAAERIATVECDKRGPKCRDRESDAQTRRNELATALRERAATERAGKLDEQLNAVRVRMAKAAPVATVNPQGAALVQLFQLPDSAAASAVYFQYLAVAVVVELLIVAALMAFELLGAFAQPAPVVVRVAEAPPAPHAAPAAQAPQPAAVGAVDQFLHDRLQPRPGGEVEVGDVYRAYREWCTEKKLRAQAVALFGDELATLCNEIGVATRAKGKKVYCVGVRLAEASEVEAKEKVQ